MIRTTKNNAKDGDTPDTERRTRAADEDGSSDPLRPEDSQTPADHLEFQTSQLGQLLKVLQWVALTAAVCCAVAFVLSKDLSVLLTGGIILAFWAVTLPTHYLLSRSNLRASALVGCSAILFGSFAVVLIWPTLVSTCVVTSILASAFALPYTSERALKVVMMVSWGVAFFGGLFGAILLSNFRGSEYTTFDAIFGCFTLGAASGISLLVLWQFRSRLMAALGQARLAEKRLRQEATHDSLTGLPNRSLLSQRLQDGLGRAASGEGSLFAVLFLDLDRFKHVNDSLGHTIGDEMLKVVSQRISASVRPEDTVARMGGDEFVIILEGIASEDAGGLAERLQTALSEPVKLHGHELYATASIGVVTSPEGYESPEELLRDADTAMYRAKEAGKARHVIFDAKMRQRAVSLLRLETDLRRAVEQNEFVVHYQPIVWLASGGVAGFEALVRWQHPERGLLYPDSFISLAEETGLVHEIDRFVLREAALQTARWRKSFPDHFPPSISVNLTALGLSRLNLTSEVEEVLSRTGLPGRALVLELTERAFIEDSGTAQVTLERLKSLGVRVQIDDFGTGYSSLGLLHRLPVNALKVDRSFVGKIGESGENAEIVSTIITMAHDLGMEVVAEGVETTDQLSTLRRMGCDYVQGYRFAKPAPAQTAGAILAAEPIW